MDDKQNLKRQKERLKNVFRFLRNNGITQEMVAEKIYKEKSFISRLISDKDKKIPDDFLLKLRDMYDINPNYIRDKSDFISYSLGKMLKNFEAIVKDWDTVYKGERQYLRLRMDENFYNFLVDYDKIKLKELEGRSLEAAIEDLKDKLTKKPKIKEYVLLPRNVFIELALEAKKERQILDEVVELFSYEEFADDSPENQ